jgi:hypothetical protein
MSYWIYLDIDTGGEHAATVAEIGNITRNLTPMIRKAIGCGWFDLQGKKAAEITEQVDDGLADMIANRDAYEELNPPNGWGDYEGCVDFLTSFAAALKDHPKAYVSVSG